MTISPEERAALRTQHRLRPPGIKGALAQCGICWRRWPCPTIRLLDAVEAAEQQVAELRELLPFVERASYYMEVVKYGDSPSPLWQLISDMAEWAGKRDVVALTEETNG